MGELTLALTACISGCIMRLILCTYIQQLTEEFLSSLQIAVGILQVDHSFHAVPV